MLVSISVTLAHNLHPAADGCTRRGLRQKLKDWYAESDVQSHRLVLATGKTMANQYEPWYFGVAFAFCFKFCTSMPDAPAFINRPRHRRAQGAPRIELPAWVRLMSRRVEAQLKRDWLLN